jgi:hypothetical protein
MQLPLVIIMGTLMTMTSKDNESEMQKAEENEESVHFERK